MTNTIIEFDSRDYCTLVNLVMVLGGWHFDFFSFCDFIFFSKIHYVFNEN
jgi:hypothetical protein